MIDSEQVARAIVSGVGTGLTATDAFMDERGIPIQVLGMWAWFVGEEARSSMWGFLYSWLSEMNSWEAFREYVIVGEE